MEFVRWGSLTGWKTCIGIFTIEGSFVVFSRLGMLIAVVVGRKVPFTSKTVKVIHFGVLL